MRRGAALPIQLQVAARPDSAEEVARRLHGRRVNGVRVDLDCTPDEKLTRLSDIAELRSLIEDVQVVPPSLEDIYEHFSRRVPQ